MPDSRLLARREEKAGLKLADRIGAPEIEQVPNATGDSRYETVIGLEVHAQLLTKSKMYCGCASSYAAAPPNTHVCPVCLGLPGALPVVNEKAIEFAVMTGLALGCEIAELSRFDRKNYMYPDLMKNYQISQFDLPIAHDGFLDLPRSDGGRKRVRVKRVHLEEDVAKLMHRVDNHGRAYTLVDVNRSGVPLMEIVSEPDIRSPDEARDYLVRLRQILQYLGVSTGSMEEGSFRCDANVSIRLIGATVLGAKVEVKNMNSFRAVFRALEYEVIRQAREIEAGAAIAQETRGWDDGRGVTVSQRSKEYAHDYRYFPEPDLPPLALSREWIATVAARLPELPEARQCRFVARYELTPYDASILTATRSAAEFFEEAVGLLGGAVGSTPAGAKSVANWLINDLLGLLNTTGQELGESKVTATGLAELVGLVEAGTLSTRLAREVFQVMFETGQLAGEIVHERGLAQISDIAELARIVDQVIEKNQRSVSDLLAGKPQALGFLVGQVMKQTRGKANPGIVNKLLAEKLAGRQG